MLQLGTISPEQLRRADREPLPKQVQSPDTRGPGGYFANYVTQQLVDRYKARGVFGGGLTVRTTLDLELQKIGHHAIARWLKDDDGPAAALVAIDPRDGSVKAMIGGSNFRESQFNLAVQGERQAGSAFKPFVLTAALEQGISPATTFVSKPQTIFIGDKYWPVSNYEDAYLGSIDLTTATIHSDNAVYAQLTALVGPKAVRQAAQELGITSRLNDYFAIGLGAEAVNPLEMARAFSTFANRGRRIDGSIFKNRPRAIASVQPVGKKRRPNEPVQRPVLDAEKADLINDILQKVVRQGTGTKAALADRPVAGKTGTTENYGDAWFVGYTPQLAVAVWVGYPNGAHADADGVRGRRRCGRHVPGADLEVLHGCGPQAPRGRAGLLRPAEPHVRDSLQRRPARRPGTHRQRRLPRDEDRLLLHGPGAGPRGSLQAERGRGSTGRRLDARPGEGAARRSAARVRRHLQAGEGWAAARFGARADPGEAGRSRPTTR